LWEFFAARLVNRSVALLEPPESLEGSGSVACEAIVDAGVVVGALLRFQVPATPDGPAGGVDEPTRRVTFGWESLNENELILAALVGDGLTNREAAARLFVSRYTVDFHLRQIYQKLGIHSRVDLARIAIERGALTT
jgi:DNA-binding CsgD family transcriptional regulator